MRAVVHHPIVSLISSWLDNGLNNEFLPMFVPGEIFVLLKKCREVENGTIPNAWHIYLAVYVANQRKEHG